METDQLKRHHWRKSSQWFVLNRLHAELANADRHVEEQFHRFCYTNRSVCVSDEHYLPTLLASYGLEQQTDCLAFVHYTGGRRQCVAQWL